MTAQKVSYEDCDVGCTNCPEECTREVPAEWEDFEVGDHFTGNVYKSSMEILKEKAAKFLEDNPEIIRRKIYQDAENDTSRPAICATGDRRVLVIGDLHLPFTNKKYLAHCIDIHEKYACTDVVFIGDVADNHFSSFHLTSTQAMSADHELLYLRVLLSDWHRAFPKAKVCLGNHDLIPKRKLDDAGLSGLWLKDYAEVLGVDGWEFAPYFTIDGVLYTHGIGKKGKVFSKSIRQSMVIGHFHGEAGIRVNVYDGDSYFGMIVGCGVDRDSYAMEYARDFDPPVHSCGVVLQDGKVPIIEPMPL